MSAGVPPATLLDDRGGAAAGPNPGRTRFSEKLASAETALPSRYERPVCAVVILIRAHSEAPIGWKVGSEEIKHVGQYRTVVPVVEVPNEIRVHGRGLYAIYSGHYQDRRTPLSRAP